MKTLSGAAISALQSRAISAVYLLKLDLPDGVVGFHNGVGILTVGGVDYVGSGTLGAVTVVRSGDALRPDKVTATLSALPSSEVSPLTADDLAAAFAADWKNRPATIYLQMYHLGTETPLTDPQVWFRGVIDFMRLSGGAGEEAKLSVDLESVTRNMTRANWATRSDAYQRQRHPDDTFYLHASRAGEREIAWGGKPQRAASVVNSGAASRTVSAPASNVFGKLS